MNSNHLFKAFILAIVIVIVSFSFWEIHLRNKGLKPDFDDNESLWSSSRKHVYQAQEKATVFIGSSRIKYDLDIATWKRLTGTNAVELASVGSNPRPYLENLAADTHFKGKLIIDITEGLFFSLTQASIRTPVTVVEYYKKITPAQRASGYISKFLESDFVFLNKEFFSLNGILDKNTSLKNRPEVNNPPDFPIEFRFTTYERQNIISDKMITDTALQNKVKNIWASNRKLNKQVPISGYKLDSILNRVRDEINLIKARGGQVLFVRTPSCGTYLEFENTNYPRALYWDRLLTVTNCPGIHFADYPAMDHLQCPEFSHLSHPDAIIYTENLIHILEQKGWFQNNQQP